MNLEGAFSSIEKKGTHYERGSFHHSRERVKFFKFDPLKKKILSIRLLRYQVIHQLLPELSRAWKKRVRVRLARREMRREIDELMSCHTFFAIQALSNSNKMSSSRFPRLLFLVGMLMNILLANAFTSLPTEKLAEPKGFTLFTYLPNDHDKSKRDFFSNTLKNGAVAAMFTYELSNAYPAMADEEDMTSKMFNSDGSLKGSTAEEGAVDKDLEAKSKTISIMFPSKPASTSSIVSVDGAQPGENGSDFSMKVSYQVPDKWTAAPEYLDTLSNDLKSCERVIIHQVPGLFKDEKILEKASLVGVAKSLGITTTVEPGVYPTTLSSADIISGRKVKKPMTNIERDTGSSTMQTYYEFDLAVAPDSCGKSAENLGLGFCPYDTIVLLSSTIVNEKMMVIGVTCKKEEWQRASADIKRVRESFYVDGTLV